MQEFSSCRLRPIDWLNDFGQKVDNHISEPELTRIKVNFIDVILEPKNWAELIILMNQPAGRLPLQLRVYDSPIKTLREKGIKIGIAKTGLIMKSVKKGLVLMDDEPNRCAKALSDCLWYCLPQIYVEIRASFKSPWQPGYPQTLDKCLGFLVSEAAGLVK
jgi:hypothetical protein